MKKALKKENNYLKLEELQELAALKGNRCHSKVDFNSIFN